MNMSDKIQNEIFNFFPPSICNISEFTDSIAENVQEIRFRVGQPISIRSNSRDISIGNVVRPDGILKLLENFSDKSIYAVQSELNCGYITIRGGHRIGISGTCIIEEGKVKNIKHISSLNIRVAREVKNCSEVLFRYIIKKDEFKNTLIISPPRLR